MDDLEIIDLCKKYGKTWVSSHTNTSTYKINKILDRNNLPPLIKNPIPQNFIDFIKSHDPSKYQLTKKFNVSYSVIDRWLRESKIEF